MRKPRDTFPCPACGAPVAEGAISCRACGADEQTGWAEDDPERYAQELDLPRPHVDDEAYDDFVREEFQGEPIRTRGPSLSGFLLVLAAVIVIGLLLSFLSLR